METLTLYRAVLRILRQHEKWLDDRHCQTLGWMITGLIQSGQISLTAWAP